MRIDSWGEHKPIMRKILSYFALSLSLSGMFAGSALAQGASFPDWLRNFKSEAAREGVSQQTIDAALNGISPIQRVIDLDRKQPESKIGFAKYKSNVITQGRIDEGRSLLRQHWNDLKRIESQYGVPPQYVVALWGMETSYGKNTGGFDVVDALATLAWEGRRAEFFKKELLDALKIIDQGHTSADNMRGSWAGAMGQCQFMPSSFRNFAVDYNGDGRKDIWGTRADVFASAANYLSKSGWKHDERWGRKVSAPAGLPKGLETRKSISEWARLGVKQVDGSPLPKSDTMMASLVVPEGGNGEAYLAYDNYRVIMKWNRSIYFATSVGLLADLIAKGAPTHLNP